MITFLLVFFNLSVFSDFTEQALLVLLVLLDGQLKKYCFQVFGPFTHRASSFGCFLFSNLVVCFKGSVLVLKDEVFSFLFYLREKAEWQIISIVLNKPHQDTN